MYAIMAWGFPIWYFFECCPERVEVYFRLRCWFKSFKLFSHVVYPFGFFCYVLLYPYFASKLYCFLVIRLLVRFPVVSLYLLVDFLFDVLGMSYFVYIIWFCPRYLFHLPSFSRTFWFIFSSCTFSFNYCVVFLFAPQHVPAFFPFFIIFLLVFVDFLYAFSNRIFHPGFEFPFVFFKGNTDFFADYFRSCIHKFVSFCEVVP